MSTQGSHVTSGRTIHRQQANTHTERETVSLCSDEKEGGRRGIEGRREGKRRGKRGREILSKVCSCGHGETVVM